MSFSLEVKNEVARLDSTRLELTSELSAIIRNNIASIDSIVINTESNVLARRIFKLFKNFHISSIGYIGRSICLKLIDFVSCGVAPSVKAIT